MKDKNESGKHSQIAERAFGVNYQWTGPDGMICRGHSVAMGRDFAQASRRFFNEHRHVAPAMAIDTRLEAA